MVCEARAYGRICYVCNGSFASFCPSADRFRSSSNNGHFRERSLCLKPARSRLMQDSTRSFIRSVGVYNLAPLLVGRITSTWEAQAASAALSALPVIGGDLVFVGSER